MNNNINVKLTPQQGIKVNNDTVYVYDNNLIDAEVQLSKDWATKTDGIVEEEGVGVDYSSKAYAIGGTGTQTNNAKYYAGQASDSSTSASLSATSASGSAYSASTNANLAKDWATKTDGTVDGSDYSSKYYAQQIIPISSDITTVAGISSNIITVASISSNVTTVANNATNINSVASDLTNIDAVANDLTNIDNAPTYANNAYIWAEGTDSQVSDLGGEKSSKGWAVRAKELVDSIGSVIRYKGSVATRSDLPTTGLVLGDMYNILSDGSNVVWNGSDWDDISGIVDLSAYRTASDQDIIDAGKVPTSRTVNGKALSTDISLTSSDVGAVSSNTSITGATKCKITYDSKGLVTAGADLQANDIPSLTLSKISDITASASELNTLDGITATTTELNYVYGVTSSIQTQIDGKQSTLVSGTNIKTVNNNSLLGSGDISIDSLPSQSGQSGKFLTTDGTNASWGNITIPTVNDATLTIQKNGTTVQTFTANASTNATANITVPTDTGDLTNGAGFITGIDSTDITTALGYTPVNPTSLATVATTGAYSDLTGKPTIPTVNDATLTIQKNGTSVGTFTSNQSTDETINITAMETDVSNITSTGKTACATFPMPSSKYEDLTLGVSGTSYTATDNGYFWLRKTTGSSEYIIFELDSGMSIRSTRPSTSSDSDIFIPCRKGGTVKVSYTGTGTTKFFRFIYAQGEV